MLIQTRRERIFVIAVVCALVVVKLFQAFTESRASGLTMTASALVALGTVLCYVLVMAAWYPATVWLLSRTGVGPLPFALCALVLLASVYALGEFLPDVFLPVSSATVTQPASSPPGFARVLVVAAVVSLALAWSFQKRRRKTQSL